MAVSVFHGDKGGVGKSFSACSHGEYLLGKGLPLVVVETDTRNADVGRYFKDAATVKKMGLRTEDGWSDLFEYVETAETSDIILSLPGNIGGLFEENSGALIEVAREAKRTLVVWWVMSTDVDSVTLLKPVIAAFKETPGTQLVAVRNLHFGEGERFKEWNEGKTRKEFLAAGGLEIDLERLRTAAAKATFGNLPSRRFSANGESGLRVGDRYFLREWVERTRVTFDSIADRVGVGKR
jgi:hypothetical protein